MPVDPLLFISMVVVIVIAILLLVRQRNSGITTISSAPPQATSRPPDAAPPHVSTDFDDEVRQWLASGSKIEAIKRVRERTRIGLKEAKDYVDALQAGQSPQLPVQMPTVAPLNQADLHAQIHQLLAKNQKIQAIKLVREQTGWGLKEAKDYVDALE